jgi:hypothetical protein
LYRGGEVAPLDWFGRWSDVEANIAIHRQTMNNGWNRMGATFRIVALWQHGTGKAGFGV